MKNQENNVEFLNILINETELEKFKIKNLPINKKK
jgi:hypothetical protein